MVFRYMRQLINKSINFRLRNEMNPPSFGCVSHHFVLRFMFDSPYFVATMNQTKSPSAADLQLRQSFRWVLLSPPLEPVCGLLPRFLRRRISHSSAEHRPAELQKIADWLLQAWHHVNKFTVAVSASSSFSIGKFTA
jgi:hypothetical protein